MTGNEVHKISSLLDSEFDPGYYNHRYDYVGNAENICGHYQLLATMHSRAPNRTSIYLCWISVPFNGPLKEADSLLTVRNRVLIKYDAVRRSLCTSGIVQWIASDNFGYQSSLALCSAWAKLTLLWTTDRTSRNKKVHFDLADMSWCRIDTMSGARSAFGLPVRIVKTGMGQAAEIAFY